MNNEIILIKNNGKMIPINEKKIKNSDLRDITYILFYSHNLNIHLLLLAPEFIEFEKAKIRFRMSVGDSWLYEQSSTDDDRSCVYLDEASFEVYSYTSLCESLFMICFTSSVNQIINGMDITGTSNVIAMVQYIDLQIYDKNNRIIYKKQYLEEDPLEFLYKEYRYFYKFKKVFHPVNTYENIKIDSSSNKFYLSNDDFDIYDTIGINLGSICSYCMVPRVYEVLSDKIEKIYYSMMVWTCEKEKYEYIKNGITDKILNIVDMGQFEDEIVDFIAANNAEYYQFIPHTILGYSSNETINNLFSIIRNINLLMYYIRFIFYTYMGENEDITNIHAWFIFEVTYKNNSEEIYYLHDNHFSESNLDKL